MTWVQRATKARWLRVLETACAVTGLAALLVCFVAGLTMQHGKVVAAQKRVAGDASIFNSDAAIQEAGTNGSHVTGRIEIPQLHLSAPMTDGVGTIELIEGVGHVPGSAVAGGLGTMALAGHRDTFFRSLQKISRGMKIHVSNASGTYVYQVDNTRVVQPQQVDVLETGDVPSLVLITCYPFHYIGAAPQRFIVHGRLLSLVPFSK